MPTVLIADSIKPSLVMSSEVFKDKITGATILVASTGKQTLEILATEKPDMCVVDFDLPDVDGVSLIHAMRKIYSGPILLTAYPDRIVEEAVTTDLFAFNDAGAWIPKPVKFDVLSAKIDQFLLDKYRLGRRFDLHMETMIIGKGAGRGKRAPKVTGRIVNLSLGGACIELDQPMKLKGGEEMTVSLVLPADGEEARLFRVMPIKDEMKGLSPKSGKAVKPTLAKKPPKGSEAKIKCTVAWIDKKFSKTGVQFGKLTDIQRKALETLLKQVVPEV